MIFKDIKRWKKIQRPVHKPRDYHDTSNVQFPRAYQKASRRRLHSQFEQFTEKCVLTSPTIAGFVSLITEVMHKVRSLRGGGGGSSKSNMNEQGQGRFVKKKPYPLCTTMPL